MYPYKDLVICTDDGVSTNAAASWMCSWSTLSGDNDANQIAKSASCHGMWHLACSSCGERPSTRCGLSRCVPLFCMSSRLNLFK